MRLEETLGGLLVKRGWTISVAESCTGGLLAARITDVAGSSGYFKGGVIAYHNELKERLLGVPARAVEENGVSEEVARAMAQGCRERLRTDIGLGITGIAGPGGGTRETPVGTIFVAIATSGDTRCERLSFLGDRASNREQAVQAALKMAIETTKAD